MSRPARMPKMAEKAGSLLWYKRMAWGRIPQSAGDYNIFRHFGPWNRQERSIAKRFRLDQVIFTQKPPSSTPGRSRLFSVSLFRRGSELPICGCRAGPCLPSMKNRFRNTFLQGVVHFLDRQENEPKEAGQGEGTGVLPLGTPTRQVRKVSVLFFLFRIG